MNEHTSQLSLLDDASAPAASQAPSLDNEGDLGQVFDAWLELGWLRPLDVYFAQFIVGEQTAKQPALALAAALVSHQLGRGHVCLDLGRALADPASVLSLPPQDGRWLDGHAIDARALLRSMGLASVGQWLDILGAAPQVVQASVLDGGDVAPAPMVVDGQRLYLYRSWRAEGDVAAALVARMSPLPPLDEQLGELLARYFPQTEGQHEGEPDWQKVAVALAATQRLAVISGGPGTGKTTTVIKLLAVLQRQALGQQGQPLRIRLAAPTGKAAARLSDSIAGALHRIVSEDDLKAAIPSEATTLHRLLGALPDTRRFRHNEQHPLPLDVLVVDEASMIDLDMMRSLLAALSSDARLVLLGDRDQLASVEAGAVLGELCSESAGFSPAMHERLEQLCGAVLPPRSLHSPLADNVTMLERSYRFDRDSGIGALARAVNAGDSAAVTACWEAGYADIARVDLQQQGDAQLTALAVDGYRHYLEPLVQLDPLEALQRLGEFQLLCALRRGKWGVEGLNDTIAQALKRRHLISHTRGWFAGRPVMVTRNDPRLGLYNGDIGLTLQDPDDPTRLRVFFAAPDRAEGVRSLAPARLTYVETCFAMTVHKSQGSEFSRVMLVLPEQPNPILTRELLYTGITRARTHCTIATAAPTLIESATQQRIWRDANLRERISRLQGE
ncbi:exodeoxyribonuclease V subunit alpha [Carnimonas bestiolae]|uniref:exodeoxyribonuclease V subunit alpha n=1 Tax=Carnimonas bestiolae TaxID=3402172 RepID=UPI003EDBCB85